MKRANEIVKQNGRAKSEQDGGPVIFFFKAKVHFEKRDYSVYCFCFSRQIGCFCSS